MADNAKKSSGPLRVNVVTPTGVITEADTDALTAPGELGEFEVLPGHIPFLTSLHPGVMTLGEKRAIAVYAVSRGYVKVGAAGDIDVLVERAVPGADVDVESATTTRDKAAKELDAWKNKPQNAEWQNIKDRHDWAQAQLDAHARVS